MYLRIVIRSFIHSAHFFVPKNFWRDIGLPCQITEKFILFRRVFDDGLGSLSSVDAKCFANESEFLLSRTSLSTSL